MKRLILAVIFLTTIFVPNFALAQPTPNISFNPDPLVFPDTRTGQASVPLQLTITNNSTWLPLYVFSTKIADSQNFQIAVDNCSNTATQPGASCTVFVVFQPGHTGSYDTSLSVISLSHDVISSVLVQGQGVAPSVILLPTSVNFGDHIVGSPSEIRFALLKNGGTAPLSISSIAASADFGVTDDCGVPLNPDASCTLSITFTPPVTGGFTGSVTITDDAADSPQSIALSGTGIDATNPDIGLSADSIDFGPQLVGTTSAAAMVTVSSNGTADLVINSIVASQNFAVSHDCPAAMPTGTVCTLSVTFTAPAAGTATGTIVISDNATDSPQTIALTGLGITQGAPQAQLSASTLDFGEQTVDQPSQQKFITITNSGSEGLLISSVSIIGDGATSFSNLDDCTENFLAPSAFCTIAATFTPADDGPFGATVSINDNAADSPQIAALEGTGILPNSGGGCSIAANSGASSFIGLQLVAFLLAMIRSRRPSR
ncbi:MAG: choice-of-anchor D domain-containing protein [bacterium]